MHDKLALYLRMDLKLFLMVKIGMADNCPSTEVVIAKFKEYESNSKK